VRVLAGDIGGTKTAVAIVEIGPGRLSLERNRTYSSGEFDSLETILGDFLRREPRRPRFAAFGVAGPVVNGRARVTKLPWTVDEKRVSQSAGIPRVRVLNDFVAAAMGLPYLAPRQLVTISRGQSDRRGPMAMLGAGPGLGQAALWRSSRAGLEPAPSEGGHADFGPRNPREDRLVLFLRTRFGRVSRDRILSGGGLALIYEFLGSEGAEAPSAEIASAFETEDRAAVIGRHGLAGTDARCVDALAMFVDIYGSEAGNLALQYRATGGVYVGGGIAPKILPALRKGAFLKAFLSKPPLEELLARIPLRVVREPRLGLFGAAAAAYRTAIDATR
jgi:glucokinase